MADDGTISAGMPHDALHEVAADSTAPAAGPSGPDDHLCPWCSAALGDADPDRCPACGARLTGDPDSAIPGVTTVDPAAVRRAASLPPPKRGLLRLLDSHPVEESGVRPSSAEALAPPSPEVRMEMIRIRAELDAARDADPNAARDADPNAARDAEREQATS